MRYTGTVQKGVIAAKGINYTDFIGENEIELTEEEYNTIPIPCRKVDGEFIPCELPECNESAPAIPLSHDLSSYFEFIRWGQSKNQEILNCAFGKGNEDDVVGIGNQMALYAWYKGTDKTTSPFKELTLMPKLSNMSAGAFSEMVMNDYLKALIDGSDYASEKVMDKHYYAETFSANNSFGKTVEQTITVTDKNLNVPFHFYYEAFPHTGRPTIAISLNGVFILPKTSLDSNLTDKKMLKWNDYGITEPGEYIIKIETKTEKQTDLRYDVKYELIAKKE